MQDIDNKVDDEYILASNKEQDSSLTDVLPLVRKRRKPLFLVLLLLLMTANTTIVSYYVYKYKYNKISFDFNKDVLRQELVNNSKIVNEPIKKEEPKPIDKSFTSNKMGFTLTYPSGWGIYGSNNIPENASADPISSQVSNSDFVFIASDPFIPGRAFEATSIEQARATYGITIDNGALLNNKVSPIYYSGFASYQENPKGNVLYDTKIYINSSIKLSNGYLYGLTALSNNYDTSYSYLFSKNIYALGSEQSSVDLYTKNQPFTLIEYGRLDLNQKIYQYAPNYILNEEFIVSDSYKQIVSILGSIK